jgi:hypothetical protein
MWLVRRLSPPLRAPPDNAPGPLDAVPKLVVLAFDQQ